MSQKVDNLSDFIYVDSTQVPLAIRVAAQRANPTMQVAGGTPSQGYAVYEYVLLEALPPELVERVITAINAQLGQ